MPPRDMRGTHDASRPKTGAEIFADFRPHPITTEGRCTVVAAAGQTLDEVFRDRLPEWEPAVASVNGTLVARAGWRGVTLREGDVVNVRAAVAGGEGSNPIAVILSIAVLVAAPYLAGGILGAGFGSFGAIVAAETVAGQLLTAAIGLGGLLIVNSLFPPRLPKPQDAGQPRPQYSISGGANRARPYEPLQLVLGTHRVFPDLAAREYTEFDEEGDQHLNQIFDFGIGDLDVGTLHMGETAFGSFDDVRTEQDVSRVTLVAGNVDTIPGGDLEHGTPLQRTTAAGTTAVAFDLSAQHFRTQGNGSLDGRDTEIRVEWRESGTADPWQSRDLVLVTPDGADARNAVRRSFKFATGRAAAWDVRATLLTEHDEEDDRLIFRASVAAFRAFQDDATDFTGRNPLAVRAKATGQLYGRMEAVNAIASQRAAHWDGARWVPGQVTGNCGDVLLRYLRGWRIDGRLVAGMGLPDSRIDLPSIQGFAEHCTAQGLECNLVIEDGRDHAAALELICQCGWGAIDRQSGKWGVLWEDAGRPMTALVTPANVVAGTLGVTYDNEGLADEVVGSFIDRTSDYQVNQIRRSVPGAATPERPVTVELDGITDGDHAAKELNRAVAAQFHHIRTIGWEMQIGEGMGIARGDVVGMSHGLVGSGAGGRLLAISADRRTCTLSREVAGDGFVWIWDLGDAVVKRAYTRGDAGEIVLDAALAAPPTGVADDPHAYRFMCFAAEADLVKLRITGKEPAGEDRLRFIARDEVDAYYGHRTADLTWNPLAGAADPHLEPVGGFSVTDNALGVRIFTWARHPSPDVVGYRIRYAEAGTPAAAAFLDMAELHDGELLSSPAEFMDRPGAGTWRFAIAAVLKDGRRTVPTFVTAALGPLPRKGTDFEEIEVYRVQEAGSEAPDRPTDGSYDFAGRTLTPPTGWAGPKFPAYTRSQVVYASTATADRGEGDIWSADEDDWSEPVVVGDADDLNIIYRRFETPPTEAPAPSQGIPAGWHDLVGDVPAGAHPIYVSIGVRRRGSENYVWGVPTQLEGQDAVSRKELTAYRKQNVTAAAPANPGARGSFNFRTGVFTPPAGWTFPWPGRTQSEAVWAITATASDEATDGTRRDTWNADGNDWVGPVLVSDEGAINIVYRRAASKPAEPANSNGVPAGWYDRVSSVPADAGRIWVSIGVRVRGGSQFNWGAPTLLEGRGILSVSRDGDTGVVTLTFDDGTTDEFTVVDGADGSSITAGFTTDASGNVTVTFSDGTSFTISAGQAGRGIRSITRNSSTGVVTVAYDDSSASATFTLADGADGVGISSIDRSATGVVTITYTDKSVDSFTVQDGQDGRSIAISSTTTLSGGAIRVVFSDGVSIDIPAGTAGADGRGIRSISRNSSTGVVTVTYDDGTTSTFTVRDGRDGSDVSRSGLYDQIRISVTGTSGTTPPSVSAHSPGWRNLTSGPNGERRGEFYITSYTYSGP